MATCLGLNLALHRAVKAQVMFTCVKLFLCQNLFLVGSDQNLPVISDHKHSLLCWRRISEVKPH